MIPNYPDAGSQSDEVMLALPDVGILIDRWESYVFDSDFLSPTDQWHFQTSGTNLSPSIIAALYVGARVQLRINGKTQASGFIDSVDTQNDRNSGTVYTISGRDVFGPICDAGADPLLYSFTQEQDLEDVVRILFEQFGFKNPADFIISNDANRTVMTGVRTTTKKGKALKAVKIAQQLQPYPAEGCFQYLQRFLHRFGLWCWPSADGTQVIVSTPDYESAPEYVLVRKSDSWVSNVIGGGIKEDGTEQPSAVIATGATYGAINPMVGMKVILVNELTGMIVDRTSTSTQLSPIGNVLGLISRYPQATYIQPREQFQAYLGTLAREDPIARPLFLHDDEAKTLDQLVRYAYRELSLRQQKMWTGEYLVDGHTQNGTPWTVDTMVTVDDDVGKGFHGPMYVRGRTFMKSRGEGTKTKLKLILPYTIDFGASVIDTKVPPPKPTAALTAAVGGSFNVSEDFTP